MKMKNIYPLLAILLLPPSHATATDHETTKDGVIIRLKQKRPEDVQSIRLQVINEKIIQNFRHGAAYRLRVMPSPESSSDTSSSWRALKRS